LKIKKTLSLILDILNTNKAEYAAMGGFAMGFYGIYRMTQDIDFLINKKDIAKIRPEMEKAGYIRHFHSENVEQYTHEEYKSFSPVDFLLAFRPISLEMLKNRKKVEFKDKDIYILLIEDIIGLKIQAVANDVLRKNMDYNDIRELLKIHGRNADWQKLRDYFLMFSMEKDFKELKKQYER